MFTPEVEEVFRWFEWTYDIDVGFGHAHYRRIALPMAGGLDEQPALLMQQLAWVAAQKNDALAQAIRRPRRRKKHDG